MSFSQRLLLKAAWRLTPVLCQIKTPRKLLCLRGVLRKEGDSNPRYAFDVYTLSRRASFFPNFFIFNYLQTPIF